MADIFLNALKGLALGSLCRLQQLSQLPGVSSIEFHMCADGMVDRISGLPRQKAIRLLGNLEREVMRGLGCVKLGDQWFKRIRLAHKCPKSCAIACARLLC